MFQCHFIGHLMAELIEIDGSAARRYTAIVTNERARVRQSVKFLGRRRTFKNAVGIVQGSTDITAK